jgi:hypothetical protein
MKITEKIKNWYDGLPINKTLKTAILLAVTTSVVIGVGYLGLEGIKKIKIVKKKEQIKK